MAWARKRLLGVWSGPGGAGEVLAVAYPLILSFFSFTLCTFVDRVFLTWYSAEAVAGSVSGLFLSYTPLLLFTGTGEYLTTFIAQYLGAGRPQRIGPAVWQGIYFSLLAGAAMAAMAPLVGPIFALGGHPPQVQVYETQFASIFLLGGFPIVLMATLSTFFSGRGATKVVLLVNLVSTAVNIGLDYLWIFGHGGFPRAGVAGAAWATVVAQAVGCVLYLALILRRPHREAYGTLSGWRLEGGLLLRLLRFGLPSGLHTSLEILAFTFFLVIVGRISTDALAATGIAFNLNGLVFVPMLGLGVAVSSLVGRHLGSERPDLAERATWSAFWMSLVYMGACGCAYVLAPRLLLAPYAAGADAEVFARLAPVATVLLRFVALYSIFDMMNVVFAAGLKGAGDTTYPLAVSVTLSWVLMLIPAWIACVHFGAGVYAAWSTVTAYVIALGLLLMRRFAAGEWKALRVIEPDVVAAETGLA